jgi:two-component system, chemotaxis family, chemotaxis protein CheY
MHIGLLEDDLAIQEMLRLVLQDVGDAITIYPNAEGCLEALTASEQVPIDVLIVDWRLPGSMSGIEVIRRIRDNPRLCSLPIILTTAAMFTDTEELQHLHVRLLEKPFDIDEMVRMMRSLE